MFQLITVHSHADNGRICRNMHRRHVVVNGLFRRVAEGRIQQLVIPQLHGAVQVIQMAPRNQPILFELLCSTLYR